MTKERNSIFAKKRKGAALIVVLGIVMVATILALAFLTRSDVELACGNNMLMRTKVDYLAESALEHARGLILNPQEISGEYFTGATGRQIETGSYYYNVTVEPNTTYSGTSRWCDYDITCQAYKQACSERIAQSNVRALLRLDPCIAYFSDTSSNRQLSSATTVYGDIFCRDDLTVYGTGVDGDVFCDSLSGSVTGQEKSVGDLALAWPNVTASDYTSNYVVQTLGSSLSGQTLGPYEPLRVCHRTGDLAITGDVNITGMLIVEGDLVISGTGNIIKAGKNVPAMLVTGDVSVENDAQIDIEGLAVIDGQMFVSVDNADVNILGALFVADGVVEMAKDSTAAERVAVVWGDPQWLPAGGQVEGALSFDGVDDYVQTGDSASALQISNDYTLSVWVKASSSQKSWAGIISKTNSSGSTNHWTLQFNSSSPKELVIYHPTNKWSTGIKISDIADQWHHIAVTRSGNIMTSYLDGNQKKSEAWSVTPGSGYGHLNIGADRTASSAYVYSGLIDDVRIYEQALLDVNDIYPPKDGLSGLISHWGLDEDGGRQIKITAAPAKTAIWYWSPTGQRTKWAQAADAFYKRIERY